jgi:hypothetical protein
MLYDSLVARDEERRRKRRKSGTYLSNPVIAMLYAGTRSFD